LIGVKPPWSDTEKEAAGRGRAWGRESGDRPNTNLQQLILVKVSTEILAKLIACQTTPPIFLQKIR
jgi:hypothetical protein